MWKGLQSIFLPPASAERDSEFRAVLTRLARNGTWVGAALGIAAVLLFVGIHVVVLGNTPGWSYGDDVVALWDKAILVGLCGLTLGLAHRVGLRGARLLVALIVAAAAFASVADDVVAGDTSFTPGYLTFMYLLAVTAVPYRPAQTLLLGAALTVTLFVALEAVPVVFGLLPVKQIKGHYVYMLIITVLLCGVSGLLYGRRYGQYRARREAEKLRAQVQALEAAKSRFFANLSHEFRTPLTLILGPVEDALAGRYGALPEPMRRRLYEMQVQAQRLRRLIDDLLDLAKLEAGRMPLWATAHDLGAFVEQQAGLFQSAAERKDITLHVEVPEPPITAWFDAAKLEHVLANLLANALKHTPAGGTIRVRLDREEEEEATRARLAVRDSGEGIAPEVLDVIFDRFAGAGHAREGQASTGIGLALVKEVVERHGGTVTATSEPGFGAEFTVHLPLGPDHFAPEDLADADIPPTSVPPAVHPTSEPGMDRVVPENLDLDAPPEAKDGPLVLIADDDASVRTYLRDLLTPHYQVLEAEDGTDALALARAHRPALIVSDVMMPGLDGFALCQQVKRDEHLASVPVVLLTARAEEAARLEGLKTGADAYLAKPFSSEELLLIAENLIAVRRLLQERVKVPDWMATKAPAVPSHDAEFLDRVQHVIGEHIGDSDFGVEWLASEVGLSARQLQRRLQALTDLTAASFIKAMRLEHAAMLLAESDLQVQEVADAVGYADANYFSRLFRQAYGMPPSEYAKEQT